MNKTPNTFDFIINDEDEVMLLLYAHDSAPNNPIIKIDTDSLSAILYRNETDAVAIDHISENVIDSLTDADTLMVCELTSNEKDDNSEIKYAYEADIDF